MRLAAICALFVLTPSGGDLGAQCGPRLGTGQKAMMLVPYVEDNYPVLKLLKLAG